MKAKDYRKVSQTINVTNAHVIWQIFGRPLFFTPLFSPLTCISASKCIENNIEVLRMCCSINDHYMSKYTFKILFCLITSMILIKVKNFLLTHLALRVRYILHPFNKACRSVWQTSTKTAGHSPDGGWWWSNPEQLWLLLIHRLCPTCFCAPKSSPSSL